MTRWPILVLILQLGCASVERSHDDAGPRGSYDAGEVGTGRTIEQACEEQVAARCREFEKCGSFAERREFASEEECRTNGRQRCVERARLAGIRNPVVRIDRCTSMLELAACGSSERARCLFLSPDVVGTLADGASCVLNAQCAGGYCAGSSIPFSPTCGTCRTAPVVGDTCATNQDCGYGNGLYGTFLWCSSAGRCYDPIGLPCSSSAPCPGLLSCIDGACRRADLPEGSTCDGATCAENLICVQMEVDGPSTCYRSELAAVGETCTANMPGLDGITRYCRGENRCGVIKGKRVCVPIDLATPCYAGATDGSSLLSCGWSHVCDTTTRTCQHFATFCK